MGPDLKPSYFIIQLRQDNTTKPIIFHDNIIGTCITINEDNITEIQSNLIKINIKSDINVTNQTSTSMIITQIKVPGNVTGILIPNAMKLMVRVLGSLSATFNVLQQDLKYINWTTFDESIRNMLPPSEMKLISAESRKIRIEWNILQTNMEIKCFNICYKMKNDSLLIGPKCMIMWVRIKTKFS